MVYISLGKYRALRKKHCPAQKIMPKTTDRQALVEQAHNLCRAHGGELLYLTLFGSALYGTQTPGKSDLDARGIWLPALESLALNQAPRGLHFSTANSERRHTSGDVDLDLWSVQRWLLELLPGGDIGALDLLFSPSHAACVLYRHPILDAVFANPLRLVNTGRDSAYAQYSLGQAKKYGIRGSRLGALKTVRAWLQEHCPAPAANERLEEHLEAIAQACAGSPFCSVENVRGERFLQLCGKLHATTTRMMELARRVEAEFERDGAAADAAGRGEGLDFKALSHALRALDQMEELLQTGKIVFPLHGREELLAVKNGKYAWEELEARILRRLAEVDALQDHAPFAGRHDAAFARSCVLDCYGLRGNLANPLKRG